MTREIVASFDAELVVGTTDPHPLRYVTVRISSKLLDELAREDALPIERYRWSVRLTTKLMTGDERVAWCAGSDEDDDFEENQPGVSLCLPATELAAEVRVRLEGSLTIDGETVVWDQWLTRGVARLVGIEGSFVETEAPTARRIEPTITAIPGFPVGGRALATLPALGLVERTADGFWLHGPNETVAIRGLDKVVDKLPASRHVYAGGMRGRLAIYSAGDGVEHVALVEVYPRGSIRVIHTSQAIASPHGCFDSTGRFYVGWSTPVVTKIDANTTSYNRTSVVFDCDAVALVDGWTGPLFDDTERCHIDLEMLAGPTRYGQLHRAPFGQPSTGSSIWIDTAGTPHCAAYHPVPDLVAMQVDDYLHVYHPTRGGRQIAMPGPGGPLVVLRDGRVLIAGDRLWLFEQDGSVGDLGAIDDTVLDLNVVEAEQITLWTHDPKRWRIDIPPP